MSPEHPLDWYLGKDVYFITNWGEKLKGRVTGCGHLSTDLKGLTKHVLEVPPGEPLSPEPPGTPFLTIRVDYLPFTGEFYRHPTEVETIL